MSHRWQVLLVTAPGGRCLTGSGLPTVAHPWRGKARLSGLAVSLSRWHRERPAPTRLRRPPAGPLAARSRLAPSGAGVVGRLDESFQLVQLIHVAKRILRVAHPEMADVASVAHHLVVPWLNGGRVEREVDQQALVL
jgi:hypothetical protein